MLLTPWYIWTVWSQYSCLGNYNFKLGKIYACDFHWERLLGFCCFIFSDRRWLIRVERQEIKRGICLIHLCIQLAYLLFRCMVLKQDVKVIQKIAQKEVSTYLYCCLQRCSANPADSLLSVALLPCWGGGPGQQHFSSSDMQIVITAFGALLTPIIKRQLKWKWKRLQ